MNKEQWIDEVLQSARSITPVEANPFLHTRVEAKLQQEKKTQSIQPAWAFSLASLVMLALILNVYAWRSPRAESSSNGLQQVMQEYGWSNNDFYSTATK